MLSEAAPQIRTAEKIIRKHEQIQDALEHQKITGKQAEQMNQTLKGITGVARLEMQFWGLMLKFGKTVPVPKSPVLRSIIGLAGQVQATDGETIRGMLPQK